MPCIGFVALYIRHRAASDNLFLIFFPLPPPSV